MKRKNGLLKSLSLEFHSIYWSQAQQVEESNIASEMITYAKPSKQYTFEDMKDQIDERRARQEQIKLIQEKRYDSCAVERQRDSNSSNKYFCID